MDDSHHGAAENSQLADLRHALQFQIGCKCGVAADVGQHGQRARGDHGAADGQPIQPIRKVHRVARTHDHEHHENDERKKRQRPQMRIAFQTLRPPDPDETV